MNEWKGNSEAFKTYFHGKLDDNGKCVPAEKIKGMPGHSWEDVKNDENCGTVLNQDFIDISFDSKELSDAFWNMAADNDWESLIFENPENNQIHSIWKKPKNWKFKDGQDIKLACGFIADLHGGSTFIRLKCNEVARFPPLYEPEQIQEIPEELYPVNSSAEPFGMAEGERNSVLSKMVTNFVYNTKFDREIIERIIFNTNKYIFSEPLPESELVTILRDETFKDLENRGLKTINAAELFQTEIKPTEFVVDKLIPIGLELVASPPKYGKSWMMLDLSIAVASGTDFMGFPTNQCSVLYLALEDRLDRLKERMLKITNGKPFPAGLEIAIDVPPLGDGFIEYLEDFLDKHPETKLVIIDTFVKIRGIPNGKESAYAIDSREAGELKKFADQRNISVILVTHTRKGIDPTDPFANITGTYGVAGAADDMIVLTKEKRSDTLTKMSVTGRDVTFEEYPVIFNKDLCKWIRQGDNYELEAAKQENELKYAEYLTGNIRKTLLKLLEENNGIWQGRCNEILEKSREYGAPIDLTSQKLGKELARIQGFLYSDKIVHTEISKGKASKVHKVEMTS